MKILKLFIVFLISISLTSCVEIELSGNIDDDKKVVSLKEIPEYDDEPYVVINNNKPDFDDEEKSTKSFEEYSELDDLGRCQEAVANIGQDLMPSKKRESIGMVKPTGWHTVKYDNVDGRYLYNRCHLIGYQLTGENANEKNLITGTRYMNVEGMLPFENMVADYIKETNHHVLYRVTPIFEGDNLVADGVTMEAQSIEDDEIEFHVFVYNVQPGIEIDYTDGNSYLKEDTLQKEIRGNSRSKVYHCPGQKAYDDMADSKYLVIFKSEQEAIDAGYRKAKQ